MRNLKLLEGIWSGDVMIAQAGKGREISRLLELMLPLQTVCLSANAGISHSHTMSEETELLPDTSLGDVIVEELSADVPYGSLIVVIKENVDESIEANICFELGAIIGDLLLDVIGNGVFPIESEAEALLILANSYSCMISSAELKSQRICVESFNNGLALSLNEYWSGDIRAMLISNDYGNPIATNARGIAKKCVNLMHDCHKKYKHSDWMKSIVDVVMKEMCITSESVYNH